MPPFRPTNLNKRAYPGNASVIGPTCTATLGFTTTTCCACCGVLCGSSSESLSLGCRCALACCAFCHCCQCCNCTVCDRTVPSGRYKASEQYEARSRDAWGDDSCSCCNITNFNVCCGSCYSTGTDYKGFRITGGGPSWFVAPCSAQVYTSFHDRNSAVTNANSVMGSCGWFVPNCDALKDPGYTCRSYWDCYDCNWYWSNTEISSDGFYGSILVNMSDGMGCPSSYRFIRKSQSQPIRAFRQAYV